LKHIGVEVEAALLATSFKDETAYEMARQCLTSSKKSSELRLQALRALIAARDPSLAGLVGQIMADPKTYPLGFRSQVLASLGKMDDPKLAGLLLSRYEALEPELRPAVIELLTQRAAWGGPLLAAMAEKRIPPSVLNPNHVRKLLATGDAELRRQLTAQWGTLRETRDPQREKLVAAMRNLLRTERGDAFRGMQVFKNVCGQCHKIHGEGQDVGPDITSNGRSDFDQLLSNVFDPSLVVGAAYQAITVVTKNGQTVRGLLVEDNAQRIVLKQQGGKLETIARADVETVQVSNFSLMPEGLEKQLKPQEIADLFAFLCLDKPPTDPTARPIKGTPR
jgi:putative heme-binding domain-containing protein